MHHPWCPAARPARSLAAPHLLRLRLWCFYCASLPIQKCDIIICGLSTLDSPLSLHEEQERSQLCLHTHWASRPWTARREIGTGRRKSLPQGTLVGLIVVSSLRHRNWVGSESLLEPRQRQKLRTSESRETSLPLRHHEWWRCRCPLPVVMAPGVTARKMKMRSDTALSCVSDSWGRLFQFFHIMFPSTRACGW